MTEHGTTTAEITEDLPEFPTPRRSDRPLVPPPELLALHESGAKITRSKLWDGSSPWLVTGHTLQRQVLSNPGVSTNSVHPGYPYLTESMRAQASAHVPTPSVHNTDGEEHLWWRRQFSHSFTRNRMEKLRPAIQKITDDLIDEMLEGRAPVDLVEALALPLPSLMICELLGVPYEDHSFFQKHAGVTNDRNKTSEQNAISYNAIIEYIGGLLEKKIANPAEDVLSDLGQRVAAGELELEQAQRLGHIMLVAGHDTSANMIALGTLILFEHPDQIELLRSTDDPKVIANAVEELLRYSTIAHLMARRAVVEDFEIEGHLLRKGEGVVASLAAGNWDPEVFPEPERLDLTRPEARNHNAFSWGPHQCIGQQLARVELQVVFGTIFRRIPTLKLAVPFEQLEFKEDSLAYGVYNLPVSW